MTVLKCRYVVRNAICFKYPYSMEDFIFLNYILIWHTITTSTGNLIHVVCRLIYFWYVKIAYFLKYLRLPIVLRKNEGQTKYPRAGVSSFSGCSVQIFYFHKQWYTCLYIISKQYYLSICGILRLYLIKKIAVKCFTFFN